MSGAGNESGPHGSEEPSGESGWRFAPRTRVGKIGHVLAWTALFYLLAWGIARLAEWLSP